MKTYTLGEIISKYRKKNHVSIRDFATESGLSRAYISVLERNINPTNGKAPVPSIQAIFSAANAMKVDPVELMQAIGFDVEIPEREPDTEERSTTEDKTQSKNAQAEIKPFPYIPLTTENLKAAIKEQRLLILPFKAPSKGGFLFYPSKKYGMTIPLTIIDVQGGLYTARHEATGEMTFSLYDIDRIVFTHRSASDAAVRAFSQEV